MSKRDANDVASERGPAGLAAVLDEKPAPQDWPEPTPLDNIGTLPRFPVDSLPGWLRDAVAAVATSTQTPADLAGTLALAVLGLCGAGKFRVSVNDSWHEGLNLFVVCSLPPGCRKSAVFSVITEPLISWERAEAERLGPEVAKVRAEYEIAEQHLKELKARAAKAKDNSERLDLTKQAQEKAAEIEGAALPALPRLFTDDCTSEKLAGLLREQDGRFGILSAEGHAFEVAAGLYSETANLNVYLKGHAGDALRVDRIGRPADYVDRPALTVALCVQPDVIESLASKPGFRGRGLLGRFLYALPLSPLGTRTIDAPPASLTVLSTYQKGVARLLGLPWATDAAGNRDAFTLKLAPEARAVLRDFEVELEPKLAEGGELAGLTDWAGKLAGAVVRMAGGLHLAAVEAYTWQEPISAATVAAAVALGYYFTAHAKAAFSVMGADSTTEAAKRALGWIRRKGCRQFARRDLCRDFHWKATAAAAVLGLLVEQEYVRPITAAAKSGPGRKPEPGGQAFEVNPHFVNKVNLSVG